MYYSEKTIELKNGKPALLRSPTPKDAAQMLEFLKTTAAETEFLLRYPEECETDISKEEMILANVLESDSNLMIACEINGEIAGNCQIAFSKRIKTRHRATIAIGIIQKYWNLGIGTAMFRELTAIAEKNGISILELSYIEGNERGKALYEKLGFVQVAELPDAIRLKDGSFRKDICMMKRL